MEGEKSDLKNFLGGNYLIKFAEDVDTLTAAYSQYVTVEMRGTNSKEVDMNAVYQYSDTVRTYILRAWISYLTLFDIINKNASVEEKEGKVKIDAIIKIVKTKRILNSEEIEIFLIAINSYLYSEPIKRLMDNARDTMSRMYNLENKDENP